MTLLETDPAVDERQWTVHSPEPVAVPDRARDAGPPAEWREHWHGHAQLLELVDASGSAAVYLDQDVPKAAGRRLLPYITEAWHYAVATYGAFGPDPRLYTVIHGGRHRGSHRGTYLDGGHDGRNVVDVGDGVWRSDDGAVLDLVNLQIGRIVETAAHGIAESPTRGIWGDGPWAEICRYDFHLALGRQEHADQLAERHRSRADDFPRPGTHWFRDWFHPLWSDCGRSRVLSRYVELLAGQFPCDGDRESGAASYRRMLTWGEFIHFSSGAARGDVSELARKAFGWRPGWDAQIERAKADFPLVSY